MTTLSEPGHRGAFVQSWRRSPREVLRKLVEDHGTDKQVLLEQFSGWAIRKREVLDVIIEYWFTNNLNSILAERPGGARSPEQRAARQAATEAQAAGIKERIERHIDQKARLILMDLIMPNGKPLRECTGRDCRTFGGWFAAIGKSIGPKDVVGDRLSEDQLRDFWKQRAG